MNGNRAVLAVVLVIVLLAAGWWLFMRRAAQTIPLIPLLASSEKRPPEGTFEVIQADINGVTKQAIYTVPASRIYFKVKVPEDARLQLAVATRPESWTQEGDGVLFRVGVADGRTYEELFTQHVNPYANEGDRKWIQISVDLSTYAGEELDLIFNTNNSAAGKGDDRRNDHALWGAPELVVR
jgi:hypothetical protein